MMWRDLFLTGCSKRAEDANGIDYMKVVESARTEMNTYTGILSFPFLEPHKKNFLDESPCASEGHPSIFKVRETKTV